MTTTTPLQMCPFCAFFGEETQPIGTDFFGGAAKIGNVPACGDCAQTVEFAETTEDILAWYRAQQEQQPA